MKIRFVIASKFKDKEYCGIVNEFIKRLSPYAKCELIDFKAPDKLGRDKSLEFETKKLLDLSEGYYRVALDPEGKTLSTHQFSDWFSDNMDSSRNIAFLIGSAFGLSEVVKASSDKLLSLSKLTMAHKIAMVVLVEQVYRAITIINRHPYHK